MKKLLLLALLFPAAAFAAQRSVDMARLAAGAHDMTPVVQQALAGAGGRDVVLSFPQGTYHFYPERAVGKYHAVTNHDNSYKYFAFPLMGCNNVTVEGNGSEFIFHGLVVPFLVEKSTGVTLRGFSVDWPEPFYAQATVLKSEAKSMEVEFTSFSHMALDGDRLGFTANGLFQPDLGETMVFDPATRAVAYRATDYILGGDRSKAARAESLGGNRYRITARFPKSPAPVGMIYVFKGPNRNNRLAPAIHLTDSKQVVLEDLVIYNACGMGVIGEKVDGVTLRRVRVPLREGSGRMVTVTADATHFCNCRGQLLIEDCFFENMLDDATNVHGTYARIALVEGPRTVLARLVHPQQLDYAFAGPADRVQVVDSLTILPRGTTDVVSVERINQSYMRIVFKSPLPAGTGVGDGLENLTWYPDLTFRNNTVRNNRARSILVSTAGKTLIEGNSFSSMMTAILFEGDLDHWHESGAVKDVLIRNNKFGDCVYGGGRGGAAIWINPHQRQRVDAQPFERNIRIEGNTFRTFDRSILNALSVEGLVFKDNVIEPSGTYVPMNPTAPTLKLEGCTGARITGNTYRGEGRGTISLDGPSAKDAVVEGQKGFE